MANILQFMNPASQKRHQGQVTPGEANKKLGVRRVPTEARWASLLGSNPAGAGPLGGVDACRGGDSWMPTSLHASGAVLEVVPATAAVNNDFTAPE